MSIFHGIKRMVSKAETASLNKRDRELLLTLAQQARQAGASRGWRNKELYQRRAEFNSLGGLRRVQRELETKGLFDVRCERRAWRDTDGERRVFTLARAATTEMWPMGTHYWVRDNSIIGARYLLSENHAHRRLGKELLLSALTFMSSLSQLKRMESIIRSSSRKFILAANNWPYIFAGVKSNLHAADKEGWAHKQDAWQILAWYVLEGLERGLITRHDLTTKHRTFLSLIVPFLIKVSFWKCENSGSWEELVAVRSSVRAWEHRLIVRLGDVSRVRGFSFLEDGFDRARRYLPTTFKKLSFEKAIVSAEKHVIKVMVEDLPFESPSYKRRDPRYREADAALIYLLQIHYPQFLATRAGFSEKWAESLEKRVVATVATLDDKATGGIARYANDTYQRQGYFRNLIARKLSELYGAPSGDASSHFVDRERIVPRGRKAMWTHFVWQLAAWAGRRYIETRNARYRTMHERYFARGLSLITGPKEASVEQNQAGISQVITIPPFRMPECYISDLAPKRGTLIFPSPHTPLNWSVAEMYDAFSVRELVLATPTGEIRKPKNP